MPGCSRERLWSWINNGEIESYLDGRARWIVVASLKARISRKVAEQAKQSGSAVR
jgi:hypothetical protein